MKLLVALMASTYLNVPAQLDSVRVCIVDAVTRQAVSGVAVLDARGSERVSQDACVFVHRGQVQFRRIGYRLLRVEISDSSLVQMSPVYVRATQLDTQHVVAQTSDNRDARSRYTVTTRDARLRGATNVTQALGLLPFAQLRSARGETFVSLRSARREQVLVTLDGIPLNDPSTGAADASELPLSLVGALTVAPGAAPLTGGPGAIGGVVALTSSTAPVVATRVGAWDTYGVEAAGRTMSAGMLWHGGLSLEQAQNNFSFVNTAGATGSPVRETRINNDETRATFFGSVHGASAQLGVIGSVSERGMVGPMNVRAYDADRAQSARLLVRGASQLEGVSVETSVRAMQLTYRDPRPDPDAQSRAVAATVNASRTLGQLALAAGTGADGVWVERGASLTRGRAFVSASHGTQLGSVAVQGGLRVDAVEYHGAHPSFSASASRAFERVQSTSSYSLQLRANFAQALRVPTLYDLYFASPQRLQVEPLAPERVTHDAELEAAVTWQRAEVQVAASAAGVSRNVRDAIIWFPGNFSWSAANVGNERLHGAEFQLRVAAPNVSAQVWSSWYDATLHAGALRIPTPYVAREAGGVSASINILHFTLSSNVRVMGRRPFSQGPRDPAFELPAVTIMDVAVSRQVQLRNLTLLGALSFDNVTNEAWQPVRGFPAPGRSWAFSLTLTPAS